ncbi:neprilysin-2-like [Diabrotica undecimpunctata]|uniref:neprilysin-2-like n=1 Tax=Diabrotica undecimpunctata TaxID=50387 RepID=UPI003B63F419
MALLKWFKRRSKLEQGLVCCVFALVIVIIVLFCCFLTSHDGVCTSPACLRAAVHILDTVDPEANPCDDFYNFTCGNFMKNSIAKDAPTVLHALKSLSENQLKEIVTETRNETVLPKSLVFQRSFYRACLDTEKIESDEDMTFLRLLDEAIGGWPIIKMHTWNERKYTWQSATLQARKLGLYHGFFISIQIYENHTSDGRMLWLKPPDATEISSFNLNDSVIDHIHDILKDLGATSVDIKADLRVAVNFVERLKEIATEHNNKSLAYNSDERRNITLRDLKHNLIKIDWLDFLRKYTDIDLKPTDQVVFDLDGYLTSLYYLFHRTPKRVQANYIAWILLSTNINYLSKKIRDKYEQITKLLEEEKTTDTRDELCYKISKNLFRNTADAEYVRRYTPPQKKKQIQTMVDYVKSAMEEYIDRSEWIDDESRENAIKRLQNITAAIGWLDEAFNITKIEELTGFDKVKHLPNKNATAIDLARMALKVNLDRVFRNINTKDVLIHFRLPEMSVNAYYLRLFNVLILPASILQDNIFDGNRPTYMNFGALGTIIGHEITHGFSLYYNLEGNEEDLWSNATIEKRTEITQCVDDEYNIFEIGHGKNKTNHTSGEENIADFNAVNIAYSAYQNWVQYNGRESTLPGITYTPNQLFWIMSSTYMCFQPKLSEKDTFVGKSQHHGIPEFRVVGGIRHSPYFANDFNCPVGSNMNPKDKCKIFGD